MKKSHDAYIMVRVAGLALFLFGLMVYGSQWFSDGPYGFPALAARTARLVRDDARDAAIPLMDYASRVSAVVPPDGKLYMPGMCGSNNVNKAGYLYFLQYKMYPRPVDIALDGSVSQDLAGFHGTQPRSDTDLLQRGYSATLSVGQDGKMELRPLGGLLQRVPDLPAHAPLLAVLAVAVVFFSGIWLLHLAYTGLLSPVERFVYGSGLGMMAASALLVATRLCGLPNGLAFVLLILPAARGAFLFFRGIRFRAPDFSPTLWLLAPVLVIYAVSAGVTGISEFDAVAAWMMKAKMLYHKSGAALHAQFSDPAFGYAHLDYPLLVPALHAFSWGITGIDDTVTKFWAVSQLVLVLMLVARCGRSWAGTAGWLLLAASLPATVRYSGWEGGTMPMVFFTTCGFVAISSGIRREDSAKVFLGVAMLCGAAMSKQEGFVVLASALAAAVLLRPFSLRQWFSAWPVWCLVACLTARSSQTTCANPCARS